MKKILVISTASTLYDRLGKWLAKLDYQILFSPDKGEILKSIIDRILPDLIAIDYGIQVVSGINLGLSIRQWSPTPLLILSTKNTKYNQIRLLDLESPNYLSKPYDMSEVVNRIDNILS
jgi:two-component system, OmpR family, KDP operon response regulator KdpE